MVCGALTLVLGKSRYRRICAWRRGLPSAVRDPTVAPPAGRSDLTKLSFLESFTPLPIVQSLFSQ